MQNNLNISKALSGIGAVLCVAAFIWWAKFYDDIAGDMNDDLDTYVHCLINPGGDCAQVSGLVKMLGGTPYSPYLLWAGILLLVIGLLVKQKQKPTKSQQSKKFAIIAHAHANDHISWNKVKERAPRKARSLGRIENS